MTSKEAKSILNAYRNSNYNSSFRDEVELAMAIDMILPKYVELEERDTPLKPEIGVRQNGKIDLVCLSCDFDILLEENFCSHCGQRLDWGK